MIIIFTSYFSSNQPANFKFYLCSLSSDVLNLLNDYLKKLDYILFPTYILEQMNFNHINRNSLINSLYSNRNTYTPYTQPEPSKVQIIEQQHHLNPSKSKVNIKQSLNKTIQNCKMNNSMIVDIRNRTYVNNNNPVSASHQIKNDQSNQDNRYFKSSKESNNGSITDRTFNKQNKCSNKNIENVNSNNRNYESINKHYESMTPMFDDKKKSQSFQGRNDSVSDLRLKFQQDRRNMINRDKQNNYAQMNSLLHKLLKRMTNNQEEVVKIKQKIQNDMVTKSIDNQLNELKMMMVEIVQNDTKKQAEFDIKIKEQLKQINLMKEALSHRDNNIYKNTIKIQQLQESLKQVKQTNLSNLSNQIHLLKMMINKLNKDIDTTRIQLQHQKQDILKINTNMLPQDISWSGELPKQWKRSCKLSLNSITLQNKQILKVIYPQQAHKSHRNLCFTLKQKSYFIDTNGYLLDQNKFYLLNRNNQQIMIKDSLLHMLRENNMLMRSNNNI